MAENTSGVTDSTSGAADDTVNVAENTTAMTSGSPDVSEDTRPRHWLRRWRYWLRQWWPKRRLTRWLVGAGAALGVLTLVVVIALAYGAVWFARTADASDEADTRMNTACGQLETWLNRLVPPGATKTPAGRAAAIRDENDAVEPLLAELDRLPERARRYRSSRADWRALLAARERYAQDLAERGERGRPAFFVLTRDDDGSNRVDNILARSPDSCDAAARRLAAPDL